MFGTVQPTPYDLRFSLFGIPVRVHPAFWIVPLFIFWSFLEVYSGPMRIKLLIIAELCVFVSILVHEMGHALCAKAFGWPPEVVIYWFGGYAAFQPYHGYTRGRSVIVSAAGPVAQLLLYAAIWLPLHFYGEIRFAFWTRRFGEEGQLLILHATEFLLWINLIWPLFNLIPVQPLDGGRISNDLCEMIFHRNGLEWSLKIGILAGGIACAYFLKNHYNFAGIFMGVLAFQSFQSLQATRGIW
jgi:Zn-dependent protease